MNGVLIVDKPTGCTSHDVVQRVRKAIRQRSVGHAGTLDPLATGVLVVAIGEGTKLVSHLQSDDKRYEVNIALGVETDSLDADGEVIDTADVPKLDRPAVERALQPFIGRRPQTAPKLSAIKVAGTPLHRRMRRGRCGDEPSVDIIAVGQLRERRIRLGANPLSNTSSDIGICVGNRHHIDLSQRRDGLGVNRPHPPDTDHGEPQRVTHGVPPLIARHSPKIARASLCDGG